MPDTPQNSYHVDELEELLARVRLGDGKAFERLYDRFSRLVYGVALRIVGEQALAEDVLQSVFLAYWHDPSAFRGGNFIAWLCRVTRNKSIDVRRKQSRDVSDGDALPEPVDHSFNESIAEYCDLARVRAALQQLKPEQRELIELGFFEDVTHEEIARRTSTPLGTVKTRIRSGLHQLRKALAG